MKHRVGFSAALAVSLLLIPSFNLPVRAASIAYGTTGNQPVLVIPVGFTDNSTVQSSSILTHRLAWVDGYIKNASYGATYVSFTLYPHPLQMNATFSAFIYNSNLQGCPKIIQTVTNAVQENENLSGFRTMVIIHVGRNFTGMRNEYWPGSLCFAGNPILDGLVIVSQDDLTTNWAHEILHSIGGDITGYYTNIVRVADLYDESLALTEVNDNVYVDGWDVMSSGFGGLTAFTRMELGWIPSQNVVSLSNWSRIILNLSNLETPSKSVQVIEIPISSKQLELKNGTTVSSSTYYIIEYRTRVGIDSNLTESTLLVTKANETRYYAGLPGLLVQFGVLNLSRGIPTYYDQGLNLSVTMLHDSPEGALVLVSRPVETAPFVSVGTSVNSADANSSFYSRFQPAPFDFGPSAETIAKQASDALSSLARGNLSQASSSAAQSQSLIKERIANLQAAYEGGPVLIDTLLIVALMLYVVRSKADREHKRVFVFEKGELVAALWATTIAFGLTVYYQASSLAYVNYGILYANNQDFANGVTEVGYSLVALILIFGFLIWRVRRSAWDYTPESDAEDFAVQTKTNNELASDD